MNYRHAFHAGNFADVMKHATLVRVLEYLRTKPAPFRVIDTHAGSGLYELTGAQASRSGEWRDGIARLLASAQPQTAAVLLAPYLAAVTACNKGGQLALYPGSPMLARRFLRVRDRLIACEREPLPAAALARNLHSDRRCKALAIDGWTALMPMYPRRNGVGSCSSIHHSKRRQISRGLRMQSKGSTRTGRRASIGSVVPYKRL